MISSMFLEMQLSKTRTNIEESVYNSSGKVVSFPKVLNK